jgi:HK97 family phage major capsid protein
MSARLKQLALKRADVIKAADTALDAAMAAAEKEARGLTAEEKKAQEAFNAQVVDIDDMIKLEAARSERGRGPSIPDVPDAGPVGGNPPAEKPKGVFASLGHMMQAVAKQAITGNKDQRFLATASGANESVDNEGAYLVQQDWGGTLLQATYDTGVLVGLVRRQPISMSANGIKFNLLDETSRANGSRYGGIQAYWAAEADAFTASKPKFRRMELYTKKLLGFLYATDELIEDATALEGFVNEWFPAEFGFKLDDAIFQGLGAGLPLGILNSPAKVTVAKETGQAAATINATNLEKMYARMPASSLGNAKWFINVECWPQLFQLSHAVGTGGVPVFVPAGGISGTPFGTLFGRPIQPIEQAAALGTEGDIVLADLNKYILADKGSIETASSIHVKFTTDEMAFRWSLRADGQPIPAAPLTPYKGSSTLSPFVTLATR